jgi:tetratricopeptide (TPR) repeat protein
VKAKVLVAVAVVLLVVVVGALVVFSGRRPAWTTSSPQALAEFNKGLEALQKVYYNEAANDFKKALKLDPDFVAAKRFLLTALQLPATDPQAKKLIGDLEKANLARLTDRERFLVSYALAAYAKDPTKAAQVLKTFASAHPDDPFALDFQAGQATAHQDWAEAKRLLTRLIEVAPNRVTAYNQLGYLEMGQGQFAEAEKMFETYRYIAPDQANPHDSLAELLILTGHYDRASTELHKALEIRPDFCASYEHLADLALMDDRPDDARTALANAEGAKACSPYWLKVLRCRIASWPPFLAGNWQGVWNAEQGACSDEDAQDSVLEVWSALSTGRRNEGEALVKKMRDGLAKLPTTAPARRMSEAVMAHIEGALLFTEGKPAEAAERFRLADEGLSYSQLGPGRFKLINRFVLAKALRAAGHADQAAAVIGEVGAVNANFAGRLAAAFGGPAGS